MSLPLPRLALALAATACAATPAVLATRNGVPDFDSQFMGQVLSYKRASVAVKEKVVEGVKTAGMLFYVFLFFFGVGGRVRRVRRRGGMGQWGRG